MSSSTKKIIILALIFVLAASAGFVTMVWQIIDTRVQLSEQMVALETERAQEASRIQLQRLATETQTDREALAKYFLTNESQSIDVLNLIENIAPQAGVSLGDFDLGIIEEQETNTSWVQTSFSFTGREGQVEQFVRILETVPYASKLMSVELAAQSSQLWEAEVVMRVQLLSYENS